MVVRFNFELSKIGINQQQQQQKQRQKQGGGAGGMFGNLLKTGLTAVAGVLTGGAALPALGGMLGGAGGLGEVRHHAGIAGAA